MRENLDDELTEVKSENAIDRITSQANPRTLERVPAGAKFRVRMVMDVLVRRRQAAVLARGRRLAAARRRCAGRRRSRGSGRVRLGNMRLVWRGRGFYAAGEAEQELLAGSDLAAVQGLASGDLAAKLT